MIEFLKILLDPPGDDVYRPLDSLTGRIEWSLSSSPEHVELRLFWYTEGRGDRDAGIASTLRVDAPQPSGSHAFELSLPSGPPSFSGRLISLIWALELVADGSPLSERVELVMSPGDGEVRLAS